MFGCNDASCPAGGAKAFPDGMEEGHLSDDEGEGEEEKDKKKKKKLKKKKKKKVILQCEKCVHICRFFCFLF